MGYEVRCHRCGRVFYAADLGEYAYKRYRTPHNYYFCSWTCLRRFDQMEELAEKERRKNGEKKALHQ